jgi:hypothetical protein
MTDFKTQYEYIFTGPSKLIERIPEFSERTDQFLGHFIKYKSVVHHGDVYDHGKAIFQFGIVNLGHYDFVENYAARNKGTA